MIVDVHTHAMRYPEHLSDSFVREADRTLICGDCVLKRITPNPILSPDPVNPSKRFPSLAEYLVSLAKLRSFFSCIFMPSKSKCFFVIL